VVGMRRSANADSDLLSVDEVAAWLRVHPNTVRNLTYSRAITSTRAGHKIRIRRADVDAYLQAQTRKAAPLSLGDTAV